MHFAGHSNGGLGQSRAAMLTLLNRILRQSWQSKQQFDADYFKDLSEDASLRRLSRICAGVEAAKPRINAGFSFAWMQKNDRGERLIPISRQIRPTLAKSASRRSQAMTSSPASGTSRMKCSLSNLLNSSRKNSRRSAYSFC